VKLYIFIHNEFRDFDKNSTQPEIRVNRVRDNESQLYIVAVLLIIIVASVAAIATTTTYALQHLFVMLKICPFIAATEATIIIKMIGWFMVFDVTFNNISVISWLSVLFVEETGERGESH
jgi:uncharacterized membrane protein YobD (UPF0266 family)